MPAKAGIQFFSTALDSRFRGNDGTRTNRATPGSQSGFTLVEVMVALAVLAIALAAVLRTMGQSIDLATDLRERTLALWVAQERAASLQLTDTWPGLDTSEGTAEMGGLEWRWKQQTTSTEVPEMRRVDIEVRTPRSPDLRARIAIFLRKP